MRRLLLLAAVLLAAAAPAAATTIRGTQRGESIVGGPAADRISARGGDDLIQVAFGGTDTVSCGAGVDVVSADLGDHVARDCERVSRRLSLDASQNPSSQHETAVEPDSFANGSTVVAAFQVGRFASGASSTIGVAASTDAGRTWRRSTLPGVTVESPRPGRWTAASDPAVAYDSAHGVWLVSSLVIQGAGGRDGSGLLVSRSADGVSWQQPVDVVEGPLLDKEWITCDNGAASQFRGRCYLVYNDDERHRIVSRATSDGGLTWGPEVRLFPEYVGVQPVVQPDGTLVVIAAKLEGGESGGESGSIVATRSTDGGATFSPETTVSSVTAHQPGEMRAIVLPSMEADAAGTLYAVWHDCRFRASCTANDVVLSTSHDGVSWTPVARVPVVATSSTVDAFLPGIGADPTTTGRLGIVYAFFRAGTCAAGACKLGFAFVSSTNAGATWSAPQRLDAQPMRQDWLARASGGRMIGDYFSTSFAAGRAVPVFTLATAPLHNHFREGIFATSLVVR